MAAFRDKEISDPLEKNVEKKNFFSNSSGCYQPLAKQERGRLNRYRNRFERNKIDNGRSIWPSGEEGRLNIFSSGSKGAFRKKASFSKGKIFLGGSIILGPTLIALVIFIVALQAGFVLEHIVRVSSGFRFGAIHLVTAKRLNHVRKELVRSNLYHISDAAEFAPYTRTSLGSRLLKVTPDDLRIRLEQRGIKPKYSTFKGGSIWAKGREGLSEVEIRGKTIKIQNARTAHTALSAVTNDHNPFDDFDRLRAMRSTLMLARQTGIPFFRFRTIIKELRSGSLNIRGSPEAVKNILRGRINESMLATREKINSYVSVDGGSTDDTYKRLGITEQARRVKQNLKDGTLQFNLRSVLDQLKGEFAGRKAAFIAAAGTSIAVGVLAFACTIRELGTMIREASPKKVRGLQDVAATMQTTTSQIRAGEMDGEIVKEFSQKFDNFDTSATYRVGIGGEPVENYVGKEGSDFSDVFSSESVFGGEDEKIKGLAIGSTVHLSDLLSPQKWSSNIKSGLENVDKSGFSSFLSPITGFIKVLAGGALDVFAKGMQLAFQKACGAILSTAGQIVIAGIEILSFVVLTILSAGFGGIGLQALKQGLRPMIKWLVVGLVAGVAIDYFIFNYLLSSVIAADSGIDSSLIDNNGPTDGARNYAAVDYGMHYLKESETLNMGGSPIPVREALAQNERFLALEEQNFRQQSVFSNLFDLNNPYSLATDLALAQNKAGGWHQKSLAFTSSLFGRLGSAFNFNQGAKAQSEQEADLKMKLFYPGQEYVIGFTESESNGEGVFDHKKNTLYVEENLLDDDYFQANSEYEYAPCLNIDLSEFLMSQLKNHPITSDVEGREYYPEKCRQQEARRYKLYYQDCLLVDNIVLWGENKSPMFSSACDHLLPIDVRDLLQQTSLDSNDLSGVEAVSAELDFGKKTAISWQHKEEGAAMAGVKL